MGGDDDDDYNPANKCEVTGGNFTRNVIIYIICGAIDSIALIMWYIKKATAKRRPTRSPGAAPSYPFHPTLVYVGWIAWLFTAPNAALFYYYRATQPGLDLACQSQYECMGVPLFGILLTVLTLNFLVGPFVQRAMRSSIISSVPIISGAERVLMLPARRGFFAAGVAKRLTTGTITCVDCWTTRFLPEDESWFVENMQREGIPASRLRVQRLTFPRLPFADNSFDLICLPHVSGFKWFDDDEDSDRVKAVKKKALELELFRVLRPGGTVWGCEAFFKVSASTTAAAEVGFVGVVADTQSYTTSLLPTKVYTGRKAVDTPPPMLTQYHKRVEDAARGITSAGVPVASEAGGAGAAGAAGDTVYTSGLPCVAGHLLVRWAVLLVLALITFGLFEWQTADWESLAVPATVPWGNQIGTQIIQVTRVVPIAIFMTHVELLSFVAVRNRSFGEMAGKAVKALITAFLGLVAYQCITWLPCFILDLILHAGGSSMKNLFYVNSWFNIIFIFVMIYGIGFLKKRGQAKANGNLVSPIKPPPQQQQQQGGQGGGFGYQPVGVAQPVMGQAYQAPIAQPHPATAAYGGGGGGGSGYGAGAGGSQPYAVNGHPGAHGGQGFVQPQRF